MNDYDLVESVGYDEEGGEVDEEQQDANNNDLESVSEKKVTAQEAAEGFKVGLEWLKSLEANHFYDKLRLLSLIGFAEEEAKIPIQKKEGKITDHLN